MNYPAPQKIHPVVLQEQAAIAQAIRERREAERRAAARLEAEAAKSLEYASPNVVEFYNHLLQEYGPDAARNYLKVTYKLTFSEDPTREARIKRGIEMSAQLNRKVIDENYVPPARLREVVMGILHPLQPPLSIAGIEAAIVDQGATVNLQILRNTIPKFTEEIAEDGLPYLKRYQSPWRGGQFVYMNARCEVKPLVGDRVIELIRRRTHREGVVVGFKHHWQTGKAEPLVRWDERKITVAARIDGKRTTRTRLFESFVSFANPDSLFVVDRPDPFTRETHV